MFDFIGLTTFQPKFFPDLWNFIVGTGLIAFQFRPQRCPWQVIMTVILLFSIICGKSEQPKTTFAGSRGDPSKAKGYSDLEEVGRHTGRIGRCPDQAAGDGAIYFARLTRKARL
jgi:hypothetical protein